MKNNIKKLAKITAEEGKVNPQVAQFVLTKLPRKSLILYLRYLRSLVKHDSVKISSKTPLNNALKKQLLKHFPKKNVIFITKPSIGDGIKVEINDTIIDLTVKGFINEVMQNLKT